MSDDKFNNSGFGVIANSSLSSGKGSRPKVWNCRRVDVEKWEAPSFDIVVGSGEFVVKGPVEKIDPKTPPFL